MKVKTVMTAAAVIRAARQASGVALMVIQKATEKAFVVVVSKRRIRNGERSTSTKSKALTTQAVGPIATTIASAKTVANASTIKTSRRKASI